MAFEADERSNPCTTPKLALDSMFFDRGVMGLRPTNGDEKRLLFSN
jgi:hypothetical protein